MCKKVLILVFYLGFVIQGIAQTSLDTAVSFTVKDVEGNTHQLPDYSAQGKIVLIDFFTVTCGPCATYASEISDSYRNFGCNTGNVVFLGINWGANNSEVSDFGLTNGAEYPEVSGLEGNGNHVVSDYGILSYPTVILIQPDGYISEKFIWPPSADHLDSLIVIHGGVEMACNTDLHEITTPETSDWILSIVPNPAHTSSVVTIQECRKQFEARLVAASGQIVRNFSRGKFIGIQPSVLINIEGLCKGYYQFQVLSESCVVDSQPLIIF